MTENRISPLGTSSRNAWAGWGAAVLISGSLVTLISLPPFVGEQAAWMIRQGFAVVCHQLPDRSPSVAGVHLAVCHRCVGLYGGAFLACLGLLILVRWDHQFRSHALLLLAIASLPLLIDWGGDWLGLWANTPSSRIATGGVAGVAIGYFAGRALVGVPAFKPTQPPSNKIPEPT